jgi:hypothetical protein
MSDYIANLQRAIRRLHGLESIHVRTVPLTEQFEGKIRWQGEVETFDVSGHPAARRCFAWADEGDDGKENYTAVLQLPPVDSERSAVRASLVAQQAKNEGKGT